jgi:hypothetical protein
MFDNLDIRKSFTITDNITGNEVEICTFNAILNRNSNIHQFMNINQPRLYDLHKNDILNAYREFNANIASLAITMGLANIIPSDSPLTSLDGVKDELKAITTQVMNDVIKDLGNISVNPVPTMEVGYYR